MAAQSRLYKQGSASRKPPAGAGGMDEEDSEFNQYNDDEFEPDEAESIKIEIEKIEYKIQRMGGTQSCGWDAADHKDFLRVRTKHKDKVRTVGFLTEMKRAVPTADEETI